VTAPASMTRLRIRNTQSVLGPSSYTVNLVGTASGTFTVTDGSTGSGNFTYTHTGTTGHLRLDYTGDFTGDFDDMDLFFQGGPGSTTASRHSGTQRVGINTGTIAGTFTYD
jgi:hypothetical protein